MPRTKRSMMRWSAASFSGALVLAGFVVLGACVTPQNDYNDWLARTADARSAPTIVDSGAFEGAPPDAGFDQTYLMACVSQIVSGDINKATLFTATLKFTPSGSGGGTLDFHNQALVVGATSLSQTVGTAGDVPGVPISADGKGDVVFGPTVVPGAANSINGSAVDFDNSTLHMIIGPGSQVCATLSGHISSPFTLDLDPTKNICIYVPWTGSMPALTQDMVHCP